MAKKKVVVVGNCQARPIAALLEKMSDEIEVIKVAIVHLLKSEQEAEYKPYFKDADFIIAQLVNDNYPCEFVRTDSLKGEYGDKVTTIINLFFKGYHPDWMYLRIPGQATLKGPLGDYHNSIIFNGWRDSVKISEIKNKLLSIDYYNLHYKNSAQESLLELKSREKNADVNICSFIQSNLLIEDLFFTFNHPSLILLKEYSRRILFSMNIFPRIIDPDISTEPLGPIIIDIAPNITNIKKGMYKGVQFELDDNNEFRVLGSKEYDIFSLISSFYDFYNIHATRLKGLVVPNVEISNNLTGQKKGLFAINDSEIHSNLITENFVNNLIAKYISSGRKGSINIDFLSILKSDLLNERIRAKFLVLYIEKSRDCIDYTDLINLIIKEKKYVKYPFLNTVICNVIFNNTQKFGMVNPLKLHSLISLLSHHAMSLNKLKLLSVDNNNQFKILKNKLINYCDKKSENENVILFNSYLCYKDFESYYLNMFPKINFKIGTNDENYLATLFKLFRKLNSKFELSLLERIIQSNNFLIVDLIISQSNNKNKYINFIIENKHISVESKYLLRRLYNINADDKLFNKNRVNKKRGGAVKSKAKIAVCISGQLRGYKETFENINKVLSDYFEFDIYISTWSNVGCRMPYPLSAADRVFRNQFLIDFKKIISSGELSWGDFQTMYPSLINLIESQNSIDKDFIYRAFSSASNVHLDIEDEKETSIESNQSKMFYKIERCFKMVEAESAELNNDYDFILRIRPDRKIEVNDAKSMIEMINNIHNNILYVDAPGRIHFFKGATVGDTLAFGKPEIMRLYSTFYSSSQLDNIVIRAHNELAYHLYSNGLSTRSSAIKPLGFYNPTLTDKDILSALITDSELRKTEVDKVFLNSLNTEVTPAR